MSNDRLESFIQENRAAFDTEVPGLRVWAKIDKQLDEKKSRKSLLRYRFRVAAAAILLVLAGGAAGSFFAKWQMNESAAVALNIAPEYQEFEQFYRQQYQQKVGQLTSYNYEDEALTDDLTQFEAVLNELREELKNVPKGSEERVVNAMINNYQTKLEILERVLERIQTTNQNNLNSKENEISI